MVEWTTYFLHDVIFIFKVKPNFATIFEEKLLLLVQGKKKILQNSQQLEYETNLHLLNLWTRLCSCQRVPFTTPYLESDFSFLFQNVALGSLKPFYQLDHQVGKFRCYLTKATSILYYSEKLAYSVPPSYTSNPNTSFGFLDFNYIILISFCSLIIGVY